MCTYSDGHNRIARQTMKRSSSVAALDDSIDVQYNKYSYEDSLLVSSMRLVTIEEERRGESQRLRKQRSNSSMSNTSSSSGLSRSSSRGSLRGWGSTASRKSYKVDLCALASMDEFNRESCAAHPMPKVRRKQSSSLSLQKSGTNCNVPSLSHPALESWGFFLPWFLMHHQGTREERTQVLISWSFVNTRATIMRCCFIGHRTIFEKQLLATSHHHLDRISLIRNDFKTPLI